MCVGLRRILLAFVVAAVAVPSMWAQKANVVPQVAGRVVRADTGAPIAGAQVTLLRPAGKLAGLGCDFDLFALLDEEGDADFKAGFELGGLGDAAAG